MNKVVLPENYWMQRKSGFYGLYYMNEHVRYIYHSLLPPSSHGHHEGSFSETWITYDWGPEFRAQTMAEVVNALLKRFEEMVAESYRLEYEGVKLSNSTPSFFSTLEEAEEEAERVAKEYANYMGEFCEAWYLDLLQGVRITKGRKLVCKERFND